MSNAPSVRCAPRKLRVIEAVRPRQRQRFCAGRSLRIVTADVRAEHRSAILLAYSDRAVRHRLAALLLRQGYDVTVCDDGWAAVRQLAGADFHLVVTGMIMPNMDGLELIRFLRSRRAAPPVIAVAEDTDPMSPIYLRNATLIGAVGTHIVSSDAGDFLANVKWMVTGRADVLKQVVW